jgi:CDP-diacylglycerol--glycerol-3-phosphate 3-phosphatidyltransferase
MFNLPNILSLYRLLAFPFLLHLALSGQERLFAIFLLISLFTDFLDGFLARALNQTTALGARLDSWADMATYVAAIAGIFLFKWVDIEPHALIFWLFLGMLLLSYLAVLLKFGQLIGLHVYLFKASGYVQTGFIAWLFLFGFEPWLFYLAMIVGVIACLEELIIIWMLKEPKSNVKGLYWLLASSTE